ncbi:DUF4440 domain-containing protein [Maricaulis sp.]|uniref:DUF4440 domain-containing protein n=1 Tax=Maricaulis sp. TaxID=1486257 RepID=UPI003296FF31
MTYVQSSLRSRGLALLVLFFGFVPAGLAQDGAAEDPDQPAILAMLERGPVGLATDFEAWAGNFHPEWSVWFAGRDAAVERDVHMQRVRDYVATGIDVEAFDFDLVRYQRHGATAIVDFNATEYIRQADGTLRTVRFSETAVLVREDGRWLIRSSSLSFPQREEAAQSDGD